MGNVFGALSQHDKAIEFHTKRLNISREFGDRAGEGTALGRLGIAFGKLGQNDKAEFSTKSLNICLELGDKAKEERAKSILKIIKNS